MKFLALAALIVGALSAGLWSLRSPSVQPPALPPTPTLPLPAALADAPVGAAVVMWVAQAQARFEPCGCVAGMYGGLMRRAVLTARLPAQRVLSCELAGWSGGGSSHELLRSRYYLRGLAAAGVDAVALGSSEIALGAQSLGPQLAEAGLLGLPVLCANLDGAAGCLPAVVVTVAGRSCLVTAVAPADAAGPGLTLRDPVEAVTTQATEAARRGLDLVILTDLDPEACKALARAVPQAALILGGRAEHPSPEPVAVGQVRVLWGGNHGKVLGSWAWGEAAAAVELLHDKLPEDAGQRAILGSYQRALAEAAFDMAASGGLRALGSASVVGSPACLSCHQNAALAHQKSRHRQAFASLERKGYQSDPDCLRCHVTALGEGGYRRGIPVFAEVGCEACHGPGSVHTTAALAGRPADGRLPKLSPATCVGCHDAENSPHFAYPSYWPRILHGP
jgi:hypothetical protein